MSTLIVSPRLLTAEERAVVKRLLEMAGLANETFAPQVDALRVVGRCDCGCPTVDFEVPEVEEPDIYPRSLVDAYGSTPTGVAVGVILWAKKDRLAGLEIYGLADDPKALPDLGTLTVDAS